MNLKDRVQVEPLDDDRWSRVERVVVGAVRTRADHAPRSWRWIGAGGFAIAAAAGAVIAWQLARSHGAAAPRAADVVVATQANGTRIDLGDAVVEAAPETSFTVARPAGGIELALARGRIELDVPHRAGKAPLIVHAGDVDVIDVGTIFTVTRPADGAGVSVDVREGEVQVARAGAITPVTAGHGWSEPMIASATATAAPSTSAHGGAANDTIATAAPSRDRDPAIPIGGPADLLGRKHTAVAPGPPPRHAHADSVHRERAPEGRESNDGGAGSGSAIMDLGAAIRAVPVEPAVDVDAKTPADAFKIYTERFTSGADADKSKMLYGMARAQFSAGRTDDALHWLDAYLKRFTSGDETEAVLWLRVRILCTRGAIDDACRAAAQTYLVHGSDADRSQIAQRITDTIK